MNCATLESAPATGRPTARKTYLSILPAPALALYALGGLFLHPAARERLAELGGPDALFGDDLAMLDCAHEGCGDADQIPLTLDDQARAIEVLHAARDFAPSDARWAVACLDRLAREHAAGLLARTARWCADRIDGGASVEHAGRELMRALLAAGGAA